jgi:hypothetical protein
MRRRDVSIALASLLALSLAGCSPGGGGAAPPASGDVPTLTRDSLPTAVGTKWTTVRGTDVPIELKIAGPWKLTAGADWSVSPYEIVDMKSVPGIEKFSDVSFVTKLEKPDNPTYYYPRRVTDEWVDHLGRIEVKGDTVDAQPVSGTAHFWPLGFSVGRAYNVSDDADNRIDATVLARNTAEVPAGKLENVYLVRFVSTPKSAGGKASTYYYMFAPEVGFVALVHPSTGDEKSGFTSARQIDLLASMPSK